MGKEKRNKGNLPEQVAFIEGENVEAIFTDVVQVNITQETVTLNLALRDQDGNKAEINHKVYMTLPHFIRFADVCSNISEDIKKQIEASYGTEKT